MPKIKCPITECEYETADLDAAIVASLLTVHSNVHSSNNVPAAKTEKDKRPSISAAGSSDEWSYFISGGPNTSAPLRSPAVTKLINSWNAVMNPSGKTSHDLLAVALQIKLRKQYLQP